MVYYIITIMPGRSREERRKSKVYKLKMQGKYPESSALYVEPEVEKKEKPKVEKKESTAEKVKKVFKKE